MSVLSADQQKQLKNLQKKIPTNKQVQDVVTKQLKVVQNNLPDKKQLKKLGKLARQAGKVVVVKKTVSKAPLVGGVLGAVVLVGGVIALAIWLNGRSEELWPVDETEKDSEATETKDAK